ncbi:hypothetical protein F6U93_03375 [Tamlana haliotis]|uniref:Lipoprotein n=1 Tax=Pseudotamlana haliotis TaxID=2614804 RepID=A0A6N6MEX3_9FLAO|nr:hypothetical protein [Tamlana haliotis]KAB1069366.1 hypothetical protein F6U93_03375 [Tamlana haliotis]
MKKISTLILGVLMLFSCGNANKNKNDKTQEMVGNDKDKHGCIASAGYTWSEINQDCIRVFEIGERLNAVEENETNSVFVIFNDEDSKLELFFLPESNASKILPIMEDGKYGSENYIFDKNEGTLAIDGAVKYKRL